jgi:hypothetical protein
MDVDAPGLDHQGPARFRIVVSGHLGAAEASWFVGLQVSSQFSEDGEPVSIITGEIVDQAMLHGVLARIRDSGLPLLGVARIGLSETEQ